MQQRYHTEHCQQPANTCACKSTGPQAELELSLNARMRCSYPRKGKNAGQQCLQRRTQDVCCCCQRMYQQAARIISHGSIEVHLCGAMNTQSGIAVSAGSATISAKTQRANYPCKPEHSRINVWFAKGLDNFARASQFYIHSLS